MSYRRINLLLCGYVACWVAVALIVMEVWS